MQQVLHRLHVSPAVAAGHHVVERAPVSVGSGRRKNQGKSQQDDDDQPWNTGHAQIPHCDALQLRPARMSTWVWSLWPG